MNIVVNGKSREVADQSRLSDLPELVEEQPSRGMAVALDGSVVPRTQVNQTRLHEGARVEIVTAVQGG
ncbi:MAG TPA: sulfur carrier protein ThiS [Propionibacteriaceae bacterium]|nr:sulfur carrier protein ThiS [Propionibacteriaceae bacterium]